MAVSTMGLLRELVTALGGTPSKFSINGLLAEAVDAASADVEPFEPLNNTLAFVGQSNAERMNDNAGDEMTTLLDASEPSPGWAMLDAAADGSSLFEESTSNFWMAIGGGIGQRWQDALDAIAAAKTAGQQIEAFYLNQGEGDAYYVGLSQDNIDAWGEGWLTVIASLRAAAGGNPRVYWSNMNRRGDLNFNNQAGYQALRRKVAELADAHPDIITLLPEMYDQDDDGGAHTTAAGYEALAPRMARKMLKTRGHAIAGGVDGPRFVSAARDGATITATLVHDGGTDITPALGIQGATYFIDGVEQALGFGTRIDATHISWTLPENQPEGANEIFAFGHGSLPVVTDYTAMLRDNQAVPLPARSCEIAVTVTNAAEPPTGPAPSIYVADPTAESADGFGLPYATVSVADGKVRVRQTSAGLWTVRIKGQAEVASGTPTKQMLAGRTYRLTATSSAPADGSAYSSNWSFVMDATNVNLASGSKVVGGNFQTAPGTLVTEMTPAADSYVGMTVRGGAVGNLDLDDIIIEDITP